MATKAELQAELDARGVAYDADATKADLEALLEDAPEAAPRRRTVNPAHRRGNLANEPVAGPSQVAQPEGDEDE
jgi:hypothetical protein